MSTLTAVPSYKKITDIGDQLSLQKMQANLNSIAGNIYKRLGLSQQTIEELLRDNGPYSLKNLMQTHAMRLAIKKNEEEFQAFLANIYQKLRELIARLEAELKEAGNSFNLSADELDEELRNAQKEYQDLLTDFSEVKRELEDTQIELDHFIEKQKQISEEISSLETELHKTQAEYLLTSDSLNALNNELASMKDKTDIRDTSEINRLINDVSFLNDKFQDYQDTYKLNAAIMTQNQLADLADRPVGKILDLQLTLATRSLQATISNIKHRAEEMLQNGSKEDKETAEKILKSIKAYEAAKENLPNAATKYQKIQTMEQNLTTLVDNLNDISNNKIAKIREKQALLEQRFGKINERLTELKNNINMRLTPYNSSNRKHTDESDELTGTRRTTAQPKPRTGTT